MGATVRHYQTTFKNKKMFLLNKELSSLASNATFTVAAFNKDTQLWLQWMSMPKGFSSMLLGVSEHLEITKIGELSSGHYNNSLKKHE